MLHMRPSGVLSSFRAPSWSFRLLTVILCGFVCVFVSPLHDTSLYVCKIHRIVRRHVGDISHLSCTRALLISDYMSPLQLLENGLFCCVNILISFLFEFEIMFPNSMSLLFKVSPQNSFGFGSLAN